MYEQQPSLNKKLWLSLGQGAIAAVLGTVAGTLIFQLENPFFAFAGALAILFSIITLSNVEFGLLVLIFISYTRFSDVLLEFHGAPSIAKPYIALLLVAIFVKWFVEKKIATGWGRSAILVGAYGLVVFSSLLYATDFKYALTAFLNFLKDGIIAVIIVILLRDWKTFQNVVWSLVLAGVFIGTISAYQGLTGTYDNDFGGFGQVGYRNIIGSTEGNRLSGPVGDPNFYAQAMLVLLPLALSRFLKEKGWFMRFLAGWTFLVVFLAVIFSYSRGAALAMVIMLLFNMFHSPPKLTDALIGMLLIIFLVSFVPNPYLERLSTISDIFGGRNGVLGDVSYRGRASEVFTAWLMFIDHPIVGVGVENYPVYYQSYSRRLGLDPRIEERQAHNLYLQVAAETGLFGILVFGFLLFSMLRGTLDAWRKLKISGLDSQASMVLSVATGIVGYLGAAMFIHAAYPRYFWVLAGIALAIPSVVENTLNNTKDELDEYRI